MTLEGARSYLLAVVDKIDAKHHPHVKRTELREAIAALPDRTKLEQLVDGDLRETVDFFLETMVDGYPSRAAGATQR